MATLATTPKVGDIGTAIEIQVMELDSFGNEVPVDLSSATSLVMKLLVPGTTKSISKTATFTTNGTDGKIRYVTQAGDLSTAGFWQIEAEVTMPGGQWSTDIYKMKVGAIL